MIDLTTFKQRLGAEEDQLPLLTLEEFFQENPDEDSIAPNQWGYGRPSLLQIWEALQKIEALPNIAWVGVALHNDTEICQEGGEEQLILAGDSIVICTNQSADEIEALVNCEWLCSDGVIPVSSSQLAGISCVPPIPEGFCCLQIVWD